MAKWRELAMLAPTLDPEVLLERSGEPGFNEAVADWTKMSQDFRVDVMTALIVGVEGLTLDGKAVDLVPALEFIMENESLREEVFNAILAEGVLTATEGKS